MVEISKRSRSLASSKKKSSRAWCSIRNGVLSAIICVVLYNYSTFSELEQEYANGAGPPLRNIENAKKTFQTGGKFQVGGGYENADGDYIVNIHRGQIDSIDTPNQHDRSLQKNHPRGGGGKSKPDKSGDEEGEKLNIINLKRLHLSAEEKESIVKTESGPEKLAYVLEMHYEQTHQAHAFRQHNNDDSKSSSNKKRAHIAAALNQPETSIKNCNGNRKKCHDPTTVQELIVYNAANFTRIVCGEIKIPPHSSQVLGDEFDHCQEALRKYTLSSDAEKSIFPANIDISAAVAEAGNGGGGKTKISQQPPIIIHDHNDDENNGGNIDRTRLETVSCNIPCLKQKDMDGNLRRIDNTPWKIFQSIDTSTQISSFFSSHNDDLHNSLFPSPDYKQDIYYSTLSFKSDIPLSYYDFETYNIRKVPDVDFKTAKKAAVLLNDHLCDKSMTQRPKRWYGALKTTVTVDSYGTCNHNKDMKDGQNIDTSRGRIDIGQEYLFQLGFEKSADKDYVTSATWDALMSGGVPILVGSKGNTEQHLPGGKKSAILVEDLFDKWEQLPPFVWTVMNNETLWNSYHAWKNDETLLRQFETKYNFTKINPDCRLCNWAYAKKYGLGWNHAQQRIQEVRVPRRVSTDHTGTAGKEGTRDETAAGTGLVTAPFRESWIIQNEDHHNQIVIESSSSSSTTQENNHNGKSEDASNVLFDDTIKSADTSDDVHIHRTIIQHDNIIDINIHDITVGGSTVTTNDDHGIITLRMKFEKIQNFDGAYFRNTHALLHDGAAAGAAHMSSISIQDTDAKVSIIVDWESSSDNAGMTSPEEGIIDIVIPPAPATAEGGEAAFPFRRLRIITEDLNTLHNKMSEYFPSSFTTMMMTDFMNPLEFFYVEEQ